MGKRGKDGDKGKKWGRGKRRGKATQWGKGKRNKEKGNVTGKGKKQDKVTGKWETTEKDAGERGEDKKGENTGKSDGER